MKLFTTVLTTAVLSAAVPAFAQEDDQRIKITPGAEGNVSLKLEIEHHIEEGVKWLLSQQDAETGAWSQTDHPAITALAVSALVADPTRDPDMAQPEQVEKGLAFIESKAKREGGIYGKGLATYNTSLSMMALMAAGPRENHIPIIANGRRFLINQQADVDLPGEADNEFDGGIGYGGSYAHSDLSNTHLALEALHYSKKALAASTSEHVGTKMELDWDAAIQFVSLSQNTEATAKALNDRIDGDDPYAVREEDKGGFVYFPGDTKAGEIELEGGDKVALRSYGSMSYAGLLSFIYAEMDPADERIASVLTWLKTNYTVEENPGVGAQGLYYYYHTMAKALSIAGIQTLTTPDGERIDWREKLAVELFDRQQADGSWINGDSSRWWEDDPILVTAYALLALEHVYGAL